MVSRMSLNRKVVVGHWQDEEVVNEINSWARAAVGWHDWQGARFVRFGDNMRFVAVTEGDKVEAEMKFGYSVNTHGIGDLVSYIKDAGANEIDRQIEEYNDSYTLAASLKKGGAQHESLREAAKI